jgi:hypothetical protein
MGSRCRTTAPAAAQTCGPAEPAPAARTTGGRPGDFTDPRAYDRYERHRDLVVERTYEGSPSARSTWAIHPVDARHSTLTIDAAQDLPWPVGLVLKPFLRRLFYGINFTPFIQEAEQRAMTTAD